MLVLIFVLQTAAQPVPAGNAESPRPVQESRSDEDLQAMIERAKVLPPSDVARCLAEADENEIVVCGEDGDRFRVAPDPERRGRAVGGPPSAPNVDGPGIFQGPATMGGLCFIPPCPGEPAYIVDFSKLPEVDQAYLKKAREAEAAERARQNRQGQGQGQAADRAEAVAAEAAAVETPAKSDVDAPG